MPAEDLQERTVILQDESLKQFEGGFTAIPNRVLKNAELSISARMTYAILLKYAWQEDFCYPAQEQIAKDLGLKPRMVRYNLDELKRAKLITWKRQGLNRPNIYYVLRLPARSPRDADDQTAHPDRQPVADPERQSISAQERQSTADYKDSRKNTHTIVNDLVDNDHESPKSGRSPNQPAISDRALHTTYHLTSEQIGRVHWLVDKQAQILGAAQRNHPHYVKRAAEAVRDGHDHLLDQQLGDFKQAAATIAVGSRPAYFHTMWTQALQRQRTGPIVPSGSDVAADSDQRFTSLFGRHLERQQDSRDRMIADAEGRGFPVPDYIRTADQHAVVSWWASLTDRPPQRT